MSRVCAQKLTRLTTIVAERSLWADQLAPIARLHGWLLEAERLLDARPAHEGDVVSNATVGSRFDAWRTQMATQLSESTLSDWEQESLTECFQALSNVRPSLLQWYDREACPRPKNDMEGSIRRLKTRYRRISGRTNWNASLLRDGRSVASDEWWEHDAARRHQCIEHVSRLDRASFRSLRIEATVAQHEQRTRSRFRHRRQASLASLEARWASATT